MSETRTTPKTETQTPRTDSKVEQAILKHSGRKLYYPGDEHIGTLVVDNFPALGKAVALRFLEWVQANPEGVISLPTGRTPEYFIAEVNHFLSTWDTKETRKQLSKWGIEPKPKPDLRGLRFVQIDEFYPINPRHQNSFYHYVQRYYIDGFGLDPERALLINCEDIGVPGGESLERFWSDASVDLDLRYRPAKTGAERREQEAIRHVDQWCERYEERIRELGGIGFFLGGIGPDGHVGFNVRGESHHSPTRLTRVNYETQAAAAGDLGGIEVARNRLVITIGLETITWNPDATAIIMAAGESKAGIVADAVQKPTHVNVPASALRSLSGARMFLTQGAAKGLRRRDILSLEERTNIEQREVERVIIDLAYENGKKIVELTEDDYNGSEPARIVRRKTKKSVETLNEETAASLKRKIEAGMKTQTHTRFLHTEPHHDDIMLGYLPTVVRNIRDASNSHHFVTLTSGFNAVTNSYMLSLCRKMHRTLSERRDHYRKMLDDGYFSDPRYRDHDVWIYLDGLAARSQELQDEGTLRRFFRDLCEVFEERDVDELRERTGELINYFETQYPGKKDLPHIQRLKGMCREWESACLWGFFGWNQDSVEHLRLGFYKGDIFTEEPTLDRDAVPVRDLLKRVDPHVVTVAFDPEASGPDTHYKVMQAISAGLKLYQDETGRNDLRILGYRNIWYRFHPAEADLFVPVSLNMLTLQHHSFMSTYLTQKDASFPSYEHDGPFPELAQKIQVDQYNKLVTCLGREYFYEHPSPLMRATRGFVFLRDMTLDEFYAQSRELKRATENA